MAEAQRSNINDENGCEIASYLSDTKKKDDDKIRKYELVIYHDEDDSAHADFIEKSLMAALRGSGVKSWKFQPGLKKEKTVFIVDSRGCIVDSTTYDERLYHPKVFGTSKPVHVFLFSSKHMSNRESHLCRLMLEKYEKHANRVIGILVDDTTFTTKRRKLPRIKWVGFHDPNFSQTFREAIVSQPFIPLDLFTPRNLSFKNARRHSKSYPGETVGKPIATNLKRSACQSPDILQMSQKRMLNEGDPFGNENDTQEKIVSKRVEDTGASDGTISCDHNTSFHEAMPTETKPADTENIDAIQVRSLLGSIREVIQANGVKLDEIQRASDQHDKTIRLVKHEQRQVKNVVTTVQQQLTSLEAAQEQVLKEVQNLKSPEYQSSEPAADIVPSELHGLFMELKDKIGDLWILVAVYLRLPKKIIDDIRIKYEQHGREVQIYFMLETWVRLKGADLNALKAAVSAVGLRAVMEGRSMPLEKLYILRCSRGQMVDDLLLAPLICDYLMEDGILTMTERNAVCLEPTDHRKASKLLDILECKDDDAFYKFVNALWRTGQRHLAEALYVGADRKSLILQADAFGNYDSETCGKQIYSDNTDLKLPTMCTQSS
ncbi:uncharacterized protein LOC106171387 [Lingula anatina]|uniref:Uncharacterized protein LOC106171387 n=1 Tax=Lingula anatina TaxID=7574 RepID=A0A1S3J9U0_LINAN|nr:uncharacterized protein LOC106171387 [Lingula anatina]|eukprot:XP_013407172.2 uncharacterized protein LOC106171387 [Lingula anatina]